MKLLLISALSAISSVAFSNPVVGVEYCDSLKVKTTELNAGAIKNEYTIPFCVKAISASTMEVKTPNYNFVSYYFESGENMVFLQTALKYHFTNILSKHAVQLNLNDATNIIVDDFSNLGLFVFPDRFSMSGGTDAVSFGAVDKHISLIMGSGQN